MPDLTVRLSAVLKALRERPDHIGQAREYRNAADFIERSFSEYHRCVECGSVDRGQQDWGLDHAQRCGGYVPRPPEWELPRSVRQQLEKESHHA